MPTQYELWRDQQFLGTFDADALKGMASRGELRRDDLLRIPGSQDAHFASSASGLQSCWPTDFTPAGNPSPSAATPVPTGDLGVSQEPPVETPPNPMISLGLVVTGAFCIVFGIADVGLYNAGIHDLWQAIPLVSNSALSWGTAIVTMTIGGWLLNLSKNSTSPLAGPAAVGGLVVSAVLGLIGLASLAGPAAILVVQDGAFLTCPEHTVRELLEYEGYDVNWDSFISDDGDVVVEATLNPNGDLLLFQWIVYDDDSFELAYVEGSGQDMTLLIPTIIDGLCRQMP